MAQPQPGQLDRSAPRPRVARFGDALVAPDSAALPRTGCQAEVATHLAPIIGSLGAGEGVQWPLRHPLFGSLRPGNVHSAEGWRDVLEPVVARALTTGRRRYPVPMQPSSPGGPPVLRSEALRVCDPPARRCRPTAQGCSSAQASGGPFAPRGWPFLRQPLLSGPDPEPVMPGRDQGRVAPTNGVLRALNSIAGWTAFAERRLGRGGAFARQPCIRRDSAGASQCLERRAFADRYRGYRHFRIPR
jgi:hypothetical protein